MILRTYRMVLVPSVVDTIRVSRKTAARMEKSGESDQPQARSKLEENVARLEAAYEPHLRAGIVGKTEGRKIVSTPEVGAGSVDNPKNQNAPSQLEENVRKLEDSFGPDGHAGIVGQTEGRDFAPTTSNLDSAAPENLQGNVGQTDTSTSGKEGSGQAKCVIQLASKGVAEAEYVEKLKGGAGLQLPDGVSFTTAAEGEKGSGVEAFDVHAYLENLSTSQYGKLVLYSSLMQSTHTLLSQNYHSFPTGTICVAGAQLQGKGRGGNAWQSPKGCLMFSFTTRMTDGRLVPFLQYVVSLAVVEAVEATCEESGISVPDVRIKWPNDLYAEGVKIGGVLCTSTYRDKTFNIVVGVGLNVGNREPTTCLDALVEKLHGGSTSVQRELLLAAIMSKFEILNKTFQEKGFSPLQEAYIAKWLHSGQRVVLEEKEPGSSSVSHVAVTIQGLTPMGYLLASDDVGEQYELHPDGNTFDFLKGLVRQKLGV